MVVKIIFSFFNIDYLRNYYYYYAYKVVPYYSNSYTYRNTSSRLDYKLISPNEKAEDIR